MTATALIVVDMQNAFLHPDGENYWPTAPGTVDNALRLIEAADAAGAVIVHVADRHRQGFLDYEHRFLPEHGVTGGLDAAFFEGFGPQGRAREIELVKRRYSAFFATELGLFLAEQEVRRTVICGVKRNVCVRATAQDAFAHGFEVVVARDETDTNRAHLGEASLEDIGRYFGRVVDTGDALDLLA